MDTAKPTADVIHEAQLEVLREARHVISQYLATAEKWRYDRVMWAFAIMLGEIPEDTPEPAPCTTPGCPGDYRYAAPGRGHLATCRYPLPVA